ncbi:MAG TPA: alkaline phosphatase family protein [Blastocatellia bacterium]|nr:alkaline phosphatase family protein [Blastocatellia bacterium]
MTHRLLLIGLDGASFNVLDPLMDAGRLPNIARLVRNGVRANLRTTFPPITAVAWSSFMTGKNPGKHGIFEFVRREQNSARELAVNASFREGRAIWDYLSDAGMRVVVHNFPCTYPVRPLNGLMISDFMTPAGRRDITHPPSLLEELETKFGPYRLHLSQTYASGKAEGVLDELFDELEYKAKVTEHMMRSGDWDAFFQYFWGTDRIQHELWHIMDETHPRHDPNEARQYRGRIHAYFTRVDEVVGRLCDLAGPDSMTWIVSDHGFGPAHKYCSFNIWLLQEGFLKLKTDALTRIKHAIFKLGGTPELAFKIVRALPLGKLAPSRGVSNRPGASKLMDSLFLSFNDVDWSRTRAFSKGNYGQIYVNLKGREPAGSVEQSEYEQVCEEVVSRLKAMRDPSNGEPWIGEVFRREEIYEGPRVQDAPDISFLPRDMRYLPLGNADFSSNKFIVDAFGISGCHRMDGVMIASGAPVLADLDAGKAKIWDVAPTLLYLLGQPVACDVDGRVLSEVIDPAFLAQHEVRFKEAAGDSTSDSSEFSPEEDAEVIERLRGLGYIG